MLKAWKIQEVVDVRTIPRSRAFPWFEKVRMEKALPRTKITYTHLAVLGGLRHAQKNSRNTGWHNASFRGYADYMSTEAFVQGLRELNSRRRKRRVAVMCSEAVWWRCHRRMIADAELAARIPVRHIMTETSAPPHQLTAFAKIRRTKEGALRLTYPVLRSRFINTGPAGGRGAGGVRRGRHMARSSAIKKPPNHLQAIRGTREH